MTVRRDLKSIIRDRQRKTGESYTAARAHVLRERDQLLGITDEPATFDEPLRFEAVVLKVGASSTARIRILDEATQITFRSRDVWTLAPGQVASLRLEKRWQYRGDDYASGTIEGTRIDVAKLGLEPLSLESGALENLREGHEPYRRPDPYAPMWLRLTAKPRRSYEMDGIAWGAFPGSDPEDNPTCDAAELKEAGDLEGARELLMDTLLRDLRCLDAHAHLGNLEFDGSPERAIVHYEIGIRIGELSLPQPFSGVLPWGCIYNRPFLRCLHGFGLCLWRLGRTEEAVQVFERILALNPNDNQGVRFCWHDLREGLRWEQAQKRDELAFAQQSQATRDAGFRRPPDGDDPL